jgi:hypothetical protein
MEGSSSLVRAVGKLAIAGEQAGFSLEQMIELLNEGLSVETLLDLISWRLGALQDPVGSPPCSSGWISNREHAPWGPRFSEELRSGNC